MFIYLLPLSVGIFTILQATLNKQMSNDLGLIHSLMIGNSIILLVNIALYFWVQKSPAAFPEFFHVKASLASFKLWYIIPAFFGLGIIIGIPFSIFKVGAAKTTIILVCAQLVTSASWDLLIEKIPLTLNKVLAMLLAVGAMVLTII